MTPAELKDRLAAVERASAHYAYQIARQEGHILACALQCGSLANIESYEKDIAAARVALTQLSREVGRLRREVV